MELVPLATALLVDKAGAEDVVHDVFIGFLRSAGKFRLTVSLKSFLATCVANRARNRNKARRRQVGDEGDALEALAPEVEQPDWVTIFGEEQQHIGRALASLPYEQREVVLLHLRGGLTFREIAQSQAVLIDTVQGRYRYGLEKLRAFLDGKASTLNEPTTSPK